MFSYINPPPSVSVKWRLMGVPLFPLAAAYGLGLGHLAGQAFHNRFMAPTAGSQLTRWSHPSRTATIKTPTPRTRTAATMKRYRSNTRTKSRRRRGRRQFGRRISRGIPNMITQRVRTVFTKTWNLAAASALVCNIAHLNSAHDPSGEFGSGQPLRHDQYSALFRKYQVMGWSIKLEVVTKDNTYPLMVGFNCLTTDTKLTSYEHYKELGGVSQLVTPDMDKTLILARGGVRRYLHPRGSSGSVEELQAAIGSDPTKLLYGHFWVQATDSGVDAGEITLVITLTQLVRYFQRESPARS